VCGADFRAPSEKQALGLASALLSRGHQAMISFGGDPTSVRDEGADRVEGLHLHRHRFRGRRLVQDDLRAAREFEPRVIHAFNPRHAVVLACRAYQQATGAPVFVHFEDDEWGLAKGARPPGPLGAAAWLARRLLGAAYPPAWRFSTKASMRWVTDHAAGLDAVIPALAQHVSSQLGRDCAVVFPIVTETPPSCGELQLPHELERRELVVYTGAIYPAHVEDVRIGLQALAEVQRRGRPVGFVHCGPVLPRLDPVQLAREAGLAEGSAAFLGYISPGQVRELLRTASVLIQPGRPTEFNRLRLPAKLQAYLASGTPTVTFATGFGELLADRREVLKTHSADPSELADRVAELLEDPDLRAQLARHGPEAARRIFDPGRSTGDLLACYRRGLDGLTE
jgi:glycosyltransferase involved in cell wall biosynthesis